MKPPAYVLSAALVAAVLAVAGMPADAKADPGRAHQTHGHHAHGDAGHGHPGHGPAHDAGKQEKGLSKLDRKLGQAVRSSRLTKLTDADATALLANNATDRSAVQAASAALGSDASDAAVAAAEQVLDSYRATPYQRAVNILRHRDKVSARIAALQTVVTPGSADASSLTTATTLLAGVGAGGFTATTGDAALKAAQGTVAQAQTLVGLVQVDVAD